MFEKMLSGLSNFTGRTGLTAQKNSPEIFLGLGITGILTATFLACRATLRAEEVLDGHAEKIDMIHAAKQTGNYTDSEEKKDLVYTYLQTGGNFLKLYGPAIAVMAGSIAAIMKGHNIMKGRNVALIAAYKAVQEGFAAYRKRVVEEHGEQADYMYKNGIRAVDIVKPAYTDENGKKHKEEKVTVMESDINGASVYARYFEKPYTDESGKQKGSSQWSPTPEYNHMFIRSTQNYFNDILKSKGHVFLNEVYDALGLERSEAGVIVGWVYDGDGDNFIDFGVFEGDQIKPLATCVDRSILMDFNCDGIIYDRFTNKKV